MTTGSLEKSYSLLNRTNWICLLVFIMQMLILIQGQTADSCDHGDIRLVGGSNNLEGRVDVCFEGVWGQMCGLRWDDREAQVVCRQLNLNPSGAIGTVGNRYGTASGPHFYNKVECTGNETNLLDCNATRLENTSSCPAHLSTTQVACQETDDATSTVENLISRTTTTTMTKTLTAAVESTTITPRASSMPTHSISIITTSTLARDSTTTSPNESSNTLSTNTPSINSVTDTTGTDGHITSTTESFEPEPTNNNNTTLLIIVFGTICGVVILMLCVILTMLAAIVAKRRGFKIRTRKAVFKTNHQRSIDNTYKTTRHGTENGRTVENQLYRNVKKPVTTVENSSYETTNLTTTDQGNREYSEVTGALHEHVYSEIALTPREYAEPRGKPQPYSVPVIEVKHLRSNGKAITDLQGYATLTNDARPYEIPQFVQTTESQPQTISEHESQKPFENGNVESSLDEHSTEHT